ncbi:hypothetical protein [Wolbachia endosymbiont of Folsomia candida]|uniref:hypothetical protein n=1 Tax=Wolbachia endosymbiont of Folsomia candida TaxID=169402 RepID=UPI000A6466D9|nr:hypothetical protein [Wolbachia endosymbiont of Folsomia candida]APR98339.1 hypothetical protein ASM33_03510 [Wolbachia endosymbiont of Folsomia candida]
MAVITTTNNDLSLSKGATTPKSDVTSNRRSTSTQSSINTSATVEGAIEKGQNWVMETTLERNKKLSNLYSSIRAYGVLVSVSRSKGSVHFNVTENHTTKRLFSIYQSNGEILIFNENGEPIDRLTKKDEKHEQWKQTFEKARKLEPNKLYTGKEFLHSIIPTLGKVLNPRIDDKHEQKGQGRWADAFLPNGEFINKYFPGLSNIFTTTPSTETTSNESVSTVGTTTESFEGIDYTTKEVPHYTDEKQIADGAFDIGNGTDTWKSGLVNGTRGNSRVLNETDVEEPTAVPAISKGTILGGTVFLALTGLTGGILGPIVLGIGAKIVYNHYKKTGQYDLQRAEKKAGLEPLLSQSTNQAGPPKPQRSEQNGSPELRRPWCVLTIPESHNVRGGLTSDSMSTSKEIQPQDQAENPSDPSSSPSGSITDLRAGSSTIQKKWVQ